MTTDPPAGPKEISVTLQVTNEVEARELNKAWQEIVTTGSSRAPRPSSTARRP